MGAEEHIAVALTPVLTAAGLDLWDVELVGASVRVLVDRPGGADLDSISAVTPAVSAVLDERDDLVPAGRYMLEVSSPGLERRLRHPRHFAAYVGKQVSVKTSEVVSGHRRMKGVLTGASDDSISLRLERDVPGGSDSDVEVPLAVIERANTVFEWGAATRAGAGPSSGKKAHAGGKREAGQPPGRRLGDSGDEGRSTAEVSEEVR